MTHQDIGKRVPCGGSCRVAAEEMIVQVTFKALALRLQWPQSEGQSSLAALVMPGT